MEKKRFLNLILTLALIGGVCLGVGLVAWGIASLPAWAESQFGPPATNLNQVQRIYLSAQLLRHSNNLKAPAVVLNRNDPNGSEKPFRVELGEAPAEITARLQKEGLVPDADAMRNYLVYAGLDKTIQAGDYQLSPRMSPLEIAHALQDATPSEVTFNILPGWRMEEIATALPTSGLGFTPEAFLKAVANPQSGGPIRAELPEGANLEGFLFPDSYQVKRNITPQAFVDLLVEDFRTKISDDLRDGFSRNNLSLYQAITLASIVQREAVVEEEMPMIASVFLNRLAAGMKLDADPTVQYAAGFNTAQNTWWTNPLSQNDLQIDSPYNTYLNWGLPPGPIANPGLMALQAVAFPAQTPYYFFRSACDGSGKHVFAETFEQHVGNACP
jgi:UPF0755 protein